MAKTDPGRAAAPDFPLWPFHCTAFYSRLASDYARYAEAAVKPIDPAQAAPAEGEFGARLLGDLTRAYWDLALAPMAAVMQAAAAQAGPSAPEPAGGAPAP